MFAPPGRHEVARSRYVPRRNDRGEWRLPTFRICRVGGAMPSRHVVAVALAAVALIVAGCAEAPSSPNSVLASSPELTRGSAKGGTTLTISSTASGFAEQR